MPLLCRRFVTGAARCRLGALARCRRGAAAVEFALVAPILVLIVIGVIEVSMVLLADTLLEGGLREAARFGITGSIPATVSREQAIRDIVQKNSMGLFDMSKLTVTTRVYHGFEQVGQPEPYTDLNGNGQYDPGEPFTDVNGNGIWDADMGVAGLGGPGDVVVYTVSYAWPLLTPVLASVFGTDGKLPLQASTVVRNEPYDVGGGA